MENLHDGVPSGTSGTLDRRVGTEEEVEVSEMGHVLLDESSRHNIAVPVSRYLVDREESTVVTLGADNHR